MALQFLRAAHDRGERALYITLSESREELLQSAESHRWTLEGITIYELAPPELSLDINREQSVVYSSDLELGETVKLVMEEVRRQSPVCVVFDSLSDIRLLAGSSLRYRRQVLALKHFFATANTTCLLIDDLTDETDDANLHSLVHGVIRLEQVAVAYGSERRRLRVHKMRGRGFRGGYHDYVIRKGGLQIFPRLVANEHHQPIEDHLGVASGVGELDEMLGGGLVRGTSSLIMGPAGSGKSTLALQYVWSALARGEKVLYISFDETRLNFYRRAQGLGVELSGTGELFHFMQIDPAELSPGEMSTIIREHIENRGVSIVTIDSLSGYQNAMLEEQFMILHMHELLTYLNQQGVLTMLILAQHGLVGTMQTPIDLTYLSDTVLLLRYFEAAGELRRSIAVMKKRVGSHDASIREYRIDSRGIRVGDALTQFSGVLTGVPAFHGTREDLLSKRSTD